MNMCESLSEMPGRISTLVSGCLLYMRVFVGHARVCFGSACVGEGVYDRVCK